MFKAIIALSEIIRLVKAIKKPHPRSKIMASKTPKRKDRAKARIGGAAYQGLALLEKYPVPPGESGVARIEAGCSVEPRGVDDVSGDPSWLVTCMACNLEQWIISKRPPQMCSYCGCKVLMVEDRR